MYSNIYFVFSFVSGVLRNAAVGGVYQAVRGCRGKGERAQGRLQGHLQVRSRGSIRTSGNCVGGARKWNV